MRVRRLPPQRRKRLPANNLGYDQTPPPFRVEVGGTASRSGCDVLLWPRILSALSRKDLSAKCVLSGQASGHAHFGGRRGGIARLKRDGGSQQSRRIQSHHSPGSGRVLRAKG